MSGPQSDWNSFLPESLLIAMLLLQLIREWYVTKMQYISSDTFKGAFQHKEPIDTITALSLVAQLIQTQ